MTPNNSCLESEVRTMPKWEGIEDASANPQPVWLTRGDNEPKWKWTPLRKCDCRAINASKELQVFVDGGRATAHLDHGILTYNFENQTKFRRLVSGIWFHPVKTDKLVPLSAYSKKDEELVEAFYQRVIAASSSLSEETTKDLKKEEVLLEDGIYKVILVGGMNSFVLRRRPRALISLETAVDLQRGYGPYSVQGETEEMELGPVKHLYFVLHGIGEAMWSRQEKSMIEELDTLRTSIHKKQHTEWKKMCAKATKQNETLPDPPNRIEFIAIEWFSHIHSASSTLKKSLTSSTLESIPLLRNIANDVIFDVLMYLTPEFCEKVLRIVTDQICNFYEGFNEVHPHFDGTYSIIGHSLGTVIAWDLLCILQDNINLEKKEKKIKKGDDEANDEQEREENEISYYEHTVVLEEKENPLISNFSLPVAGENRMAGYQAYIEEEGDLNAARAGTWGPRLPIRMTKSIPFVPHATILLGSPLGMFLTLRGAHPVFEEMRLVSESASWSRDRNEEEVLISPFRLPSGAIYNIFHPSDPVAYRIEPLLLCPHTKDLPPTSFLVLQGKDKRFHIKAREFRGNVMRSLTGMFQNNNSSSESDHDDTTMEENDELQDIDSKGKIQQKKKKSKKKAKKKKLEPVEKVYNFPLGGRSDRVDFQIQTGVVENEYISAVSVHGNYLGNNDVVDFIVECCTYE